MRATSLLATAALVASSPLLGLGTAAHASPDDDGVVGHVYQPTNDAAGNAVTVFDRHAAEQPILEKWSRDRLKLDG